MSSSKSSRVAPATGSALTTVHIDGDNIDGNDPECDTAVCGNGVIEAGEQCDDGTRTEWLEDDCVDPADGTSRAQVTAELIDYTQLLKTLTRIDEAVKQALK